jgi:hypothetical protein
VETAANATDIRSRVGNRVMMSPQSLGDTAEEFNTKLTQLPSEQENSEDVLVVQYSQMDGK